MCILMQRKSRQINQFRVWQVVGTDARRKPDSYPTLARQHNSTISKD